MPHLLRSSYKLRSIQRRQKTQPLLVELLKRRCTCHIVYLQGQTQEDNDRQPQCVAPHFKERNTQETYLLLASFNRRRAFNFIAIFAECRLYVFVLRLRAFSEEQQMLGAMLFQWEIQGYVRVVVAIPHLSS